MATLNTNLEVIYKRTMFFWDKASPNPVVFDATLDTYGGPLDFVPDFFIVKSITYLSKNEASDDFNLVLTCNFGETALTILGTFSPEGSIKQPNTYHRFISREDVYTDLAFNAVLLNGKDTVQTNTIASASTWLCQIEFGKYREII